MEIDREQGASSFFCKGISIQLFCFLALACEEICEVNELGPFNGSPQHFAKCVGKRGLELPVYLIPLLSAAY